MIRFTRHFGMEFRFKKRIILILILLLIASIISCSRKHIFANRDISSMKRVALIIGNSNYNDDSLVVAENNSQDVAQWVRQYDFSSLLLQNLSKIELEAALSDFRKTWLAKPNDVVLFYYSGLAFQVLGTNYLIPAKSNIKDQNDIIRHGIDLNRLITTLNKFHPNLTVAILDIEPPPQSWQKKINIKPGLAPIKPPEETIIVYSIQPDQWIQNLELQHNSLFTGHLLNRLISHRNLPILDVFEDVKMDVAKSSLKKQVPWISSFLKNSPYYTSIPAQEPTNLSKNLKTFTDPYTKMEFVRIKGGRFTMGDTRNINIPDEKWIYPVIVENHFGKKIVTQWEWEQIMGTNPSQYIKAPNSPVDNIRGKELKVFIKRLNKIATNYAIPKNSIVITDEHPPHLTQIDSFYLGRYEVTQKQWTTIMGNNPAQFKIGDNYPVESVSFGEVKKFINRLNQKAGGTIYRLPTEAEWEYVCKNSKINTLYPWGNYDPTESMESVTNILNSDYVLKRWIGPFVKSYNDGYLKTSPVGQFPPNTLGIYDLSGNVSEWTQDWYDEVYYNQSKKNNPKGPKTGSVKSIRGGSWMNHPQNARCSRRNWADPKVKNGSIGFRLVRLIN